MKKVIVVSKTHLDLGFTDYAENIRQKYIDTFIPEAIDLAESVNKDGKKYFVWTTGSWILKEALEVPERKAKLENAINLIPFGKKKTVERIVRNIIYLGLTKRIEFLDKSDEEA